MKYIFKIECYYFEESETFYFVGDKSQDEFIQDMKDCIALSKKKELTSLMNNIKELMELKGWEQALLDDDTYSLMDNCPTPDSVFLRRYTHSIIDYEENE